MIDRFENITVGETAVLIHRVTGEDVRRFVELTGDDNPLHVDPAYAVQTRFHDVVAHGMLGASFVSTIIGKYLPGPGALWLSQSFEFLAPTRIGDELTVHAEVIEKIPSQRLLDLAVRVTNQNGQELISGKGRVQVLEPLVDSTYVPAKAPPVAIVTGGSRGIGAAICRSLAAQGFAVVVNYRSDRESAALVVGEISGQGGRVVACQADVSDASDLRRLVSETRARFGDATVLVNNATGSLSTKSFEASTPEDFEEALRLNLHGPLAAIREVIPGFRRVGKGSVVNLGSVTCDATPSKNMSAYTTAKAALVAATKCLAVEYGPENIRFNVVSPGFTNTRLVSGLSDRARLLTKAQTPLGRLADPEQVAAAVAFLAGDGSSHVTGEVLRVNGGLVMI
jgi:3-oxoacyl-[acyl-carrier protein] reductase